MPAQTKKTAPKRAAAKKQPAKSGNSHVYEIVAIAAIAVSILLILSLYFDAGGFVGGKISVGLKGLFGACAYLLPLYAPAVLIHSMMHKNYRQFQEKYLLCACMFFVIVGGWHVIVGVEGYEYRLEGATLAQYWMRYFDFGNQLFGSGMVGELISRPVSMLFGRPGAIVFFIALFIILFICVFDVSFFRGVGKTIYFLRKAFGRLKSGVNEAKEAAYPAKEAKAAPAKKVSKHMAEMDVFDDAQTEKPAAEAEIPYIEPEIRVYNKGQEGFAEVLGKEAGEALHKKNEPDKEISAQLAKASENGGDIIVYEYPSLDLLTPPKLSDDSGDIEAALKKNSQKLIETLKSFGVNAKVLEISMGPTVTRYEIAPDAGVKVSKIVGLSKDIALNLAAKSVRIEAPIPGKSAVGIEIANKTTNIVTLREVLDSDEFRNAKSKLSVALGKDIGGNPIIIDIAKMPHLLIAGATGAGKSVCINTLVMSILYKADPNEVKLVMIDPKVVELGVYNGAPHLLIPVVTDPKKAAGALNWAVSEMTDRYGKFADSNVRDIKGYNELMELNGTPEQKMPEMVIIIDELADLMMVAPSDVETYICRLAQMARAAGMHLVIATQRPSVNVITGTIKANIPSRISFMVSSQIDSRTILDMAGAEKLVGRGDMLYMPVGASSPIRLQCSYVSDKEVESVVRAVSQNCAPNYQEDVIERLEAEDSYNPDGDDPGDRDEFLPAAIELAVDSGQISTSLLQRRFRIGYNRAGSIIDQMERRGIISGLDGNKPRQVLVTREEYNEMLTNGRI